MPLCLAEWFLTKTFYNQLNYAYASANEVEVLLMLCRDFKYVNSKMFAELYESLDKFKAHIYKFMLKIERELSEKQKLKSEIMREANKSSKS